MRINPAPEIKKGLCFLGLVLAWMFYLFFDPFSAAATAIFLVIGLIIAYKEFP